MSKFGHFGPKSINFLILTKFCLYPVLKVLISNQTFVFENFKPKFPDFGVVSQKKNNFLILTKLHLPLFDRTDFNYKFEQKFQNVGLMGQNQSTRLG